MTAPYAREWVAKAEEDYLSALALLRRRKRPLPNSVCFHAHPCVEKYMKAVLANRKRSIPRTYDLVLLLEQLASSQPEYEFIRDVVRTLNPYAVEIRYPGESATPSQAKQTVQAMKTIRAFVRERLSLQR